jgi:hypothetical protein
LTLYPAQTGKARLMRWGLRRALAFGLPVRRVEFQLSARAPLARLIAELNGDLTSLAVLVGNPRLPGRRTILLVQGTDGKPPFVVKAGQTAAAVELIERERSVLEKAGGQLPGVPVLRGGFREGGRAAWAMDYVAGDSPAATNHRQAAEVLTGWLDNSTTLRLPETKAWARLQGTAAASQLRRDLERRLADRAVRPALFHGDFVPWNIKQDPATGAWTVLDWERGEFGGPPGWDWFHFVLQTGALVERLPVAALRQRLTAALATAAFQGYATAAQITGVEREWCLGYLLYCNAVIRPTESLPVTLELERQLATQWLRD